MNKKKTMLMSMSSVIAATIGLTVFGGTVFAAPGDPLEPTTDHYRIWVANTEITSDNRDNVLAGDPVNDGKVKYDPVNHILSFDDAVITTGYDYYQGNTCGVFIEDYSSDGYNNNYVYIDGSVSISGVNYGIFSMCELGTCNEGDEDVINVIAADRGITASTVNLNNAEICIEMTADESVAVLGIGQVSIVGTDLTISNSNTGVNMGIVGNSSVFVGGEDSKLDITSSGSCILSISNDVNLIAGDINLKSTGDKSAFVFGETAAVAGYDVFLKSGNLFIKIDSNMSGIGAERNISIDNCDLRINAKQYGLASDGKITFSTAFSSNCIEIAAPKAVYCVDVDVDVDSVKAPANSGIAKEETFEYIANEDGTYATYVVINEYDLSYIEAKDPTLESDGNIAYYQAGTAGGNCFFEDELGTKKIADKSSVIIPKLVAMPDVTGMNYEEAKTKLEGFLKDNNIDATINVGWGPNSDPAKNLLVSQSTPAAGTVIDSSTKEITIMVYEGYNPPANDDKTPTNNETSNNDTNKDEPNAKIASFVDRLYKLVLGRDADEEGKKYWVNELSSFDKSGASVAQGFMFSDEFINGNSTDEQFVNTLYNTFFDREADADGLKYWLGQLSDKKMTRYDVANGFIFSQEWADTCATYGILSGTNVKPSVEIKPTELTYSFVERLYKTALNREFDNDGREYWAAKLANFDLTGEQVGVEFFLSAEMKDKGLSNEEFVNRLYLTFMNREPDADGKAYWIGVLDKGADRSSVVYGFTRSAEFTDKCVEARILPC